jgi:hypothetical protein
VKSTEKDLNEIEMKIQQGYHLLIYGLDNDTVSTNDLIEEIFFEVKNYSRVSKEDIFILDELSLISIKINNPIDFLVSTIPNFKDYDKLSNLGRCVIIKFKHEKDALKFYVEKNKFNFPLVNGRRGSPNMQPTETLKEHIDKN